MVRIELKIDIKEDGKFHLSAEDKNLDNILLILVILIIIF